MLKTNCLNCSTEFSYSLRNNNKHAKYCSRECKATYQKNNSGSIRNCVNCNNTFYAKGNPKNRILCSRKCVGEYRRNGSDLNCSYCNSIFYKSKVQLSENGIDFCSINCANKSRVVEKVKINCKICEKEFEVYQSEINISESRNQKIQYCSMICRNNDPYRKELLMKMCFDQNKNSKPNKLELFGSKLLTDIGCEFIEQHIINDKISVDIYIPSSNLIIQWWGDYWHGHESKIKNGVPNKHQKKRMALDISQKSYLIKCGYKILCFWEHEVYKNTEIVLEQIKSNL